VAKQLANKNKSLVEFYSLYCNNFKHSYNNLKGTVHYYKDNKIIANCFSQKPNYDTDYEMIKKCFKEIKEFAIENELSICMPYKYGCGIANGNWEIVEDIIINIFDDYDITIYKLEV